MAALKKISNEELRKARRAGFKRKKPKKPKQSASLNAMEGYVSRYNDWVNAAREKIRYAKQKEAEKKRKKDLYKKIRSC